MQQVSPIAGDRPGQLCHAVPVDDKRLFHFGLRTIHLRVGGAVDDPVRLKSPHPVGNLFRVQKVQFPTHGRNDLVP